RRSRRARLQRLQQRRIAASVSLLDRGCVSIGCPKAGRTELSTERKLVTSQIRGKSTDFPRLIAPVEVARASPEGVVGFDGGRLVVDVFAGPLEGNGRLRRDGRLGAVHRVLDAGLLLGLEEWVVVERIVVLVTVEGQLSIEL